MASIRMNQIKKVGVLLVIILVFISNTLAFAKIKKYGDSSHVFESILPNETDPFCIDQDSVINEIKSNIKLNKNSNNKYEVYLKIFVRISDIELIARLAYSETLAANCSDLDTFIAPLIVEVIENRIRIRKGNTRSVIFQKDQFASSLNIYEKSRYLDFLCPKDRSLWTLILKQIQLTQKQTSKKDLILTLDTVNYFLYNHDPRWIKEPWDLKENLIELAPNLNKCIRFFHNKKWN